MFPDKLLAETKRSLPNATDLMFVVQHQPHRAGKTALTYGVFDHHHSRQETFDMAIESRETLETYKTAHAIKLGLCCFLEPDLVAIKLLEAEGSHIGRALWGDATHEGFAADPMMAARFVSVVAVKLKDEECPTSAIKSKKRLLACSTRKVRQFLQSCALASSGSLSSTVPLGAAPGRKIRTSQLCIFQRRGPWNRRRHLILGV